MFRSRKIVTGLFGLLLLVAAQGCNRGDATPSATTAISGAGDSGSNERAGGSETARKAPSDPQHPVVRIETSMGNIIVQLDGDKTPLTVDNFLSYINNSYYDQTIIHQVYKGQGIVGGGYSVKFVEKPTRTPVRNEAQNGRKNVRGTISMVRQPGMIDSATCQFLINITDNPSLDHRDRTPEGYGYCAFGEVVEGMDVVEKINNVAVHDVGDFERTPVAPVVIQTIRRIR